MFSAFNKGTHKVLIAAMTLGAVLTHRADAAELKVCIDQANPTAAMDLRVVRAAARTQGYSVNLHSFEG